MLKVIFLGAGEIAYKLLCELNKHADVIITAIGVDKKNFNSGLMVKDYATLKQIPFIEELSQLDDYEFDFVFMINYPSLIKKEQLDKYKFINVHYAPLPRYRGFHGFIWSIINGESKTGFTVHQVSEGIDNGPIYYQFLTEITNQDTGLSLITRIDAMLVQSIYSIFKRITEGYEPLIQDEKQAIHVCRRKPEDGYINWDWDIKLIFNHIRALTPPLTPGAYTYYKNNKIILLSAELWDSPVYFSKVGQLVAIVKDKGVLVKCHDGVLLIKEIGIGDKIIKACDYFKRVGIIFQTSNIEKER